MDYPVGWSMQSRRKQPSLYDEYLSEGRSNAPSSPRTELHQSSPTFPGFSSQNLTIRTISPDPIAEIREPFIPNSTSAAGPTSNPPSWSNSNLDRDTPTNSSTSISDSPTLPSIASTGSLRRKAPPPISTSSPLSTTPTILTSPDDSAQQLSGSANSARHPSPGFLRKFSQPNSPTGSTSESTSPTSATFAGAFAERYGKAKRKYGSMSSADLLAAQQAKSQGTVEPPTTAPPPIPPPQQQSPRPTTSSLPSLPPSASLRAVPSADTQPRPWLAPSASQPAFAVVSPRLATPGFIRPHSSRSDTNSISDPLPTSNTRRVLHLMKTLCGRMSGGLVYRRDATHAWTSAYCFIEELEGSLMSEFDDDSRTSKYLIVDIRACQVTCHFDMGTEAPYLQVMIPTTAEEVHLKLPSQADLESWHAALLCWQPIARKGMNRRLPRTHAPTLTARPADKGRQDSDSSTQKEVPIVRIGRMIYWDNHVSFGNMLPMTTAKYPVKNRFNQVAKAHGARRWRRVSCTLRENGELKFFTDGDSQVVAVVQLAKLTRDAIVRLNPSVMDCNHGIAIFPQYTYPPTLPQATPNQILLSLESRTNWEVWFVLLSAFTAPYTYGPSPSVLEKQNQVSPASPGRLPQTFRLCENLIIKVNDARLPKDLIHGPPASTAGAQSAITTNLTNSPRVPSLDKPCGFYIEITLDGQVRGRTQLKDETTNPSWRQEYELLDIPADLSKALLMLKYRPPDSYASQGKQGMPHYHDAYGQLHHPHMTNADTGFVGVFRDIEIGRIDLSLIDLEQMKDAEHWWPVLDDENTKVGELSLRLRANDHVVMLREEYEAFSRMLHKFETGLTVQLSLQIPMELKRLSEVLVNIFQASGRIIDWLMSLIEEEVDGVNKDSFLTKSRHGQEGRGDAVRDMNKNATLEANLLFRGNTLLTKALDVHMRRIGSEYLAAAIGQVIKEINEADADCEVDPNRVSNANDVQRNWTRLIATTEKVWEAIASSADSCPTELKLIFRHIRACAEDKYGDFLRTIKYSSVSGFLFLRLFCPAVLNPKLFGLLKYEPPPRSRRAFTLVAKSLQTLANMATFGSKEYWMEPMNAFLTSHRTSFKDFIDKVCFMAVEPTVIPEPQPAHSAPNTIRGRLPQVCKEGLLSLPYLIDESREYADLVELWLHSDSQRRKSTTTRPAEDDKMVQLMQTTCKGIRQRAEECLFRSEKARRPGPDLERQWEELIDSLQANSTLTSDTLRLPSDIAEDSSVEEQTQGILPARSLDALRISGTDGLDESVDIIGATPPLKQLDWTTAPDGGAATAEAATLLGGERSPRSAFVLASPNIPQRTSSPASPALATFHSAPNSAADALSGSAPSSRPGSSLSMRAASRLTRMRSGPGSDIEDANPSRRSGQSAVRTSSRRRRDEKTSAKQEVAKTSHSSGVATTPTSTSKSTSSPRDQRDPEVKESERQRIRDLVNGLTFGRRRGEKAAAAAAEKAAASAFANGGPVNFSAVHAAAAAAAGASSGAGAGPGANSALNGPTGPSPAQDTAARAAASTGFPSVAPCGWSAAGGTSGKSGEERGV